MASKGRKPQAPKATPERAAQILIEGRVFGISKTCEKFGITRQTYYNYKSKLTTDDELLQTFTELKQEYEDELHSDIVDTIRVILSEVRRRAQSAVDGDDAKCLTAIATAFQTIADYKFTSSALSDVGDEA